MASHWSAKELPFEGERRSIQWYFLFCLILLAMTNDLEHCVRYFYLENYFPEIWKNHSPSHKFRKTWIFKQLPNP